MPGSPNIEGVIENATLYDQIPVKVTLSDKTTMEGLIKNGKWKEGSLLKLIDPTGKVLEGKVKDNAFNGVVKCTHPDGRVEEGVINNGFFEAKS